MGIVSTISSSRALTRSTSILFFPNYYSRNITMTKVLAVVILALSMTQTSASFFDTVRGAFQPLENSVSKLFTDVVSDLKVTIDCTIMAVEHVFSWEAMFGMNVSYYDEKCMGHKPENVSLMRFNDSTYVESSKDILLQEKSVKELDETIIKSVPDVLERQMIEDAFRNETLRLQEIHKIICEELDKLTADVEKRIKKLDHDAASAETVLNEVRQLYEIEQHDKSSSRANDVRHTFDKVLTLLQVNDTGGTYSDDEEVKVIMKGIGKSLGNAVDDVEIQFSKWKQDGKSKIQGKSDGIKKHKITAKPNTGKEGNKLKRESNAYEAASQTILTNEKAETMVTPHSADVSEPIENKNQSQTEVSQSLPPTLITFINITPPKSTQEDSELTLRALFPKYLDDLESEEDNQPRNASEISQSTSFQAYNIPGLPNRTTDLTQTAATEIFHKSNAPEYTQLTFDGIRFQKAADLLQIAPNGSQSQVRDEQNVSEPRAPFEVNATTTQLDSSDPVNQQQLKQSQTTSEDLQFKQNNTDSNQTQSASEFSQPKQVEIEAPSASEIPQVHGKSQIQSDSVTSSLTNKNTTMQTASETTQIKEENCKSQITSETSQQIQDKSQVQSDSGTLQPTQEYRKFQNASEIPQPAQDNSQTQSASEFSQPTPNKIQSFSEISQANGAIQQAAVIAQPAFQEQTPSDFSGPIHRYSQIESASDILQPVQKNKEIQNISDISQPNLENSQTHSAPDKSEPPKENNDVHTASKIPHLSDNKNQDQIDFEGSQQTQDKNDNSLMHNASKISQPTQETISASEIADPVLDKNQIINASLIRKTVPSHLTQESNWSEVPQNKQLPIEESSGNFDKFPMIISKIPQSSTGEQMVLNRFDNGWKESTDFITKNPDPSDKEQYVSSPKFKPVTNKKVLQNTPETAPVAIINPTNPSENQYVPSPKFNLARDNPREPISRPLVSTTSEISSRYQPNNNDSTFRTNDNTDNTFSELRSFMEQSKKADAFMSYFDSQQHSSTYNENIFSTSASTTQRADTLGVPTEAIVNAQSIIDESEHSKSIMENLFSSVSHKHILFEEPEMLYH